MVETDTSEHFYARLLRISDSMQSKITADGSYIYIQDFLPNDIVYHRYDLHSQSWLADVSGFDGKSLSHLINGVPLGYSFDGQLINTLNGGASNKDDNCSVARDLWQSQVRNGSAYSYGKEVAYENGVSFADYVAGQAIVIQRTNAITCSDKHSLKYADQRYKVYSGFAASTTDGEGHNYVARSFFTGSAYQPDYVTQYDNSGKVINTVKQAESEGGEVASMLVSGDGRRLLIEHKSFSLSLGRFRSTNIQ